MYKRQAYKRYFNTRIGPWDLSRIVDNGRLYILIEYNIFWTGLARSGLVRTRPARVRAQGALFKGPQKGIFYIFCNFWKFWDFWKNRFFGLFNGSGGPGSFKIVFRILKYPGGLIYSFRSQNFHQFSWILAYFHSILLINLSQTAYFDDLTVSNGRKLDLESAGMNIIFIRAIGCSFMPGEGPISVRPGPARSGPVRPGPARSGPVRLGPARSGSVRPGPERTPYIIGNFSTFS